MIANHTFLRRSLSFTPACRQPLCSVQLVVMTNDARGVGATLREGRAEARDLGSEIAGIAADLKGLGRAEARLAAAEIRENIGLAVRGLAFAVVASVIGLMSIGFAGATAMIALSLIMPLWAAGLVANRYPRRPCGRLRPRREAADGKRVDNAKAHRCIPERKCHMASESVAIQREIEARRDALSRRIEGLTAESAPTQDPWQPRLGTRFRSRPRCPSWSGRTPSQACSAPSRRESCSAADASEAR